MMIALILAAIVTSDYGVGAFLAPQFLGRNHSSRTALRIYSPSSSHDTENIELKLEQKTWTFRNKYSIAFEVATVANNEDYEDVSVETVPILLLNGFGVGSFHQHRLMRRMLLEQNDDDTGRKRQKYVLYGIDYLGQGKSWPTNCDDGNSSDESNLGYSADMWLDQLTGFIEEVIVPTASSSNKVHLVGNSVGGYLSTILACRHPHLVSSLALMNATPVWGLNLPGWDGRLPAPGFPKMVGRKMFDTIRNLDVIDKYLEAAYVHREAYDGSFADGIHGYSGDEKGEGGGLPAKIRGCTEGKGGHAAFASILWSPPASSSSSEQGEGIADFYDSLRSLPIDVLLLFGSDDPWCTPAIAKRMHTAIHGRRANAAAGRYVSLENAGHCPNHEAPASVARVLSRWIGALPSSSSSRSATKDEDGWTRSNVPLISSGDAEVVCEPWGAFLVREVSIDESRDLGIIDRVVSSMVG
mmetsp:Transcript_25935/g.62278  ORF Transcript_25935/g.62278 Transcript_25935/m.62278 type:complete len:469 (+) Transcript_25935:295-1701(+)